MTFPVERRLTRSCSDRMLFGVCSGLGEYFGVDPTIVRLAFVLVAMAGGLSILAYPILVIVMPPGRQPGTRTPVEAAPAARRVDAPVHSTLGDELVSTIDDDLAALAAKQSRRNSRPLVGFLLIGAGLFFLLQSFGFFWWLNLRQMWPLVLIAIGLALLLARRRNWHDL